MLRICRIKPPPHEVIIISLSPSPIKLFPLQHFKWEQFSVTLNIFYSEGGRGKTAQTYDEVVKDLIMSEKCYLRDLHMITKVFREQIQRLELASTAELDAIFSNINDITELTITLIGSLEDTLEMSEDGTVTAIGSCFEELAEAEEFEVYEKYSRDVLNVDSR